MKNYILLFILLSGFISKAQINTSDSTVQVVAYWSKNEKQTYSFINEKIKVVDNDSTIKETIKYKVDITILDSTDTGYTIEWKYRGFEASNNVEIIQDITALYNGLSIKFTTDEIGSFQELLNLNEIKEYQKKAFDLLAEKADNPTTRKTMEAFRIKITSDSSIVEYSLKDINIFHSFFGIAIGLNETIEESIEEEQPLGEPISTLITIALDEVYIEDASYVIKYWQEFEKEGVKNLLKGFISDFMKTTEMNEMDNSISDINLTDYYGAHMHETGWPLFSRFQRTVTVNGVQSLEVKTIELE